MSFSAQVTLFSKGATQKIEAVRRAVVIKLFSAVILDTPVDTGRLRGNWRVSEGKPILEATERKDKSGSLVINEVVAAANASKGDTSMFLSNSLPYASVAEYGGWHGPTDKVTDDGFSRKSPKGMVRRNVVRFAQLIKAEAAKK